MVAAKPGIRIPINHSIGLNLVSRITFLIEILAVVILDGSRVPRPIRKRDNAPTQYNEQRGRDGAKRRFHGEVPRAANSDRQRGPGGPVVPARRGDFVISVALTHSGNAKTVS